MNYDHAFHAGNAADVMKHAVLGLLLERLRRKPAPFAVIDSHAGAGLYDLAGDAARRTAEADQGIGRLWPRRAEFPDLNLYLDAVAAANPDGELRVYPGSPAIAAAALRPDDRLVLVEAAEAPAAHLRRIFGRDRRVAVHRRDGWEALGALLPPRPRRGMVLIDPPFEAADEFDRLAHAVAAAARRWPGGIVAAWYPIKDDGAARQLAERLAGSGTAEILRVELAFRGPGRGPGLVGSGMVLVRPPWQLDSDLGEIMPRLARALGLPASAARVDWLAGERPRDEA
jgi:23S rRNA (adenine2030-N6)-methyltransferase